ncbi:diaminopimelate epimerase [Sphingomonas ginsenosidivorax]|uniref:Diaminopimelate epimerase n=1 Tax=Sphingomonas ginsenosidivorax TaxID=862135 RepID=A0A5C6UL30_9SPHN|nr:diaminopimelate epimerase [Sphingomonas ginsenosidivorax]TXC72178.1 diaminopimelate epimerase [Sphingomonas ginsenosidivorax]
MRFDIIKCHGSGNDFPLIDARALSLGDAAWAGVARALADRAGPVGGDGLLLLTAGDDSHAFGMRMFNSDGSESETCLNGLRCTARAGFEALGIERGNVRLKISDAYVVRDPDLAPGVFTVRETAGPASRDVAAWPMAIGRAENIDLPIARLPTDRAFTALAMPNPHLVAFVDKVDDAELVRIGTVCESAPDWLPNRANVSFVELRGCDLFVRTFERGVGLTDSCGSAMGASTLAACLTGRIPFDVPTTVFNKGGRIRAEASADGMVTLSGNATVEWTGSIDVDPDTGVATALTIAARHPDEIAAWSAVVDSAA